MSDFRENYFRARNIVAQEFKEKYGLIVTRKEYNCLTLDSETKSIHLTFIIPNGDEVYISDKGKEWFLGKSFKDFLFEKYHIDSKRTEVIKHIFKGKPRHPFSFESIEIIDSFRAKINFLLDSFSENFI